MEFGLFYFANAEEHQQGYELLVAGARFADRNGFSAVWTPERHFHEFGGIYPNPAVTGAAIAAVTEHVAIRAGSVVAPLHNPIRIAEEWSVVDNLSGGRAGIAFASGWHAGDFVFSPGRYHDRRADNVAALEQVRRLWRGESVTVPDGVGNPVEIRTLPRPVQAELPVWLTTSGSIESFESAGRLGVNVLTHLLGQELADIEQKVKAYHAAWHEAGHTGRGHVSLMIHTYLGTDRAAVKEVVREPFSQYLLSSFDLIARAVGRTGSTETAGDIAALTDADRRFLIDAAFDRYFRTNGLFGSVEDGVEICGGLQDAGVDELACLIDFGVDSKLVLDGLDRLGELRQAWTQKVPAAAN
ncbi:LLM class flavin-dependent oxidoreductase [Amycolatopsis sp. NPDC051758]|uniref:LLM class flavin-dependent oxidoreductase n=1 Tax=Amycolatopsis sp. NPDC051758 TaxID=3363935 RepID=UPI0037A0A114